LWLNKINWAQIPHISCGFTSVASPHQPWLGPIGNSNFVTAAKASPYLLSFYYHRFSIMTGAVAHYFAITTAAQHSSNSSSQSAFAASAVASLATALLNQLLPHQQ
jgi:hypothetical protein